MARAFKQYGLPQPLFCGRFTRFRCCQCIIFHCKNFSSRVVFSHCQHDTDTTFRLHSQFFGELFFLPIKIFKFFSGSGRASGRFGVQSYAKVRSIRARRRRYKPFSTPVLYYTVLFNLKLCTKLIVKLTKGLSSILAETNGRASQGDRVVQSSP